jgi:iron(III) transport system substrate-binding protein
MIQRGVAAGEKRLSNWFLGVAARAFVAGLAIAPLATLSTASAQDAKPSWFDQTLADAARKEGSLVVYSTTNEEEGLPLWKPFEDATGVKVNYVRASDSQLLGRVLIENRAGQHSWDLMQTANVNKIPREFLLQTDLPEAGKLIKEAIDPERRWYGVYSNYNSPAYNTKLVKREDLPKSYEDFANHKEWAGHVAIDGTDDAFMTAILMHYGEDKGVALLKKIIAAVQPVTINGHLAVARAVGSGEYWFALNNYVNLTLNAKIGGAPTDFWTMDPIPLFFGQVGIATLAPHPAAAKLAANFLISREAQGFLTKFGRIPTRPDVTPNPPDIFEAFKGKTVQTVLLSTEEDRRRIKQFNDLFAPR